jgi:hypothetical protein
MERRLTQCTSPSYYICFYFAPQIFYLFSNLLSAPPLILVWCLFPFSISTQENTKQDSQIKRNLKQKLHSDNICVNECSLGNRHLILRVTGFSNYFNFSGHVLTLYLFILPWESSLQCLFKNRHVYI